MADWTTIDVNDLLPGEPWTSAKANAVYENVTATAEGAEDAPRVEAAALKSNYLIMPNFNTGTTYDFTSTNPILYGLFETFPGGESAGSATLTLQYRTSTDGGSTLTAFANYYAVVYSSGDNGVPQAVSVNFPADTNYVRVQTNVTVSGLVGYSKITLFGEE